MNRKFIILIVLSLLVVLTGCQSTTNEKNVSSENIEEIENDLQEKDTVDKEEEIELGKTEPIDLSVVKPNEAGEIMVLMYHHIAEPEAEWTRTPDNFRRDLQTLYDKGYRPISLEDYVTGNINTEAGFKPVVLTFDDGPRNNFNMIETDNDEWEIDPDSAVGILLDFHEKNPDFPLEATFFINGGVPFGQEELVEYKLNFIVDHGMDIGNHTYNHINFTNATADEIQEEIGRLNNLVNNYLPDYEVNTLALPFGSKPRSKELREFLVEGEYQGNTYHNSAILEVGWDPYHSPYHDKFDPTRIRRVRASETKVDGVGMYDWLNILEHGGRIPFVSDGNPDQITVPEGYEENIRKNLNLQVKTY
ncbi:polysaccharide deacetylase family protein [Serpentinicella sp. ANB-PHB4]|uniref:polysaccharide deacetylase family protein n=1 Tax=Serpentinicella sp. ANB-PHB4 TaxID=3074076 RepID=UPI0028575534|nr:polysaccharide deacetylase family protein [Serpentinicella sp. ANB-PHB4]MDR5659386.1 polysaccharide deacetylase family protein [Serpentinicella sp. ANB-PHB4]